MDSSPPPSRLTPLQQDLLTAFFEREQRFFLTGGGALVGFYFGHRSTEDLDFFSPPGPLLDDVVRTFEAVVTACGASVRTLQSYPDFRRLMVSRGSERCIVDLVIDHAPMIEPTKAKVGIVRLDTLREIAANKLATLVGRSEIKDLVDLRQLLNAGYSLEQALDDAVRKDAGVDPATLAWVLDQITISATARLPGGVDPSALLQFRDALVRTLRTLAFQRTQAKPKS